MVYTALSFHKHLLFTTIYDSKRWAITKSFYPKSNNKTSIFVVKLALSGYKFFVNDLFPPLTLY